MRKKILYFALDKRDTTSFFRVHGILPYINNPEFELIPISGQVEFDWTVFQGVSAMIFQRPFVEAHSQVIKTARNHNVKVILDYDDLLIDDAVDMYNPTHALYKYNQTSLKECLRDADEIWVTTQEIKTHYLPYNDNIHIIPNAHNDYLFKVKDKLKFNSKNKKCFWRGGSSHDADVMEKADFLVDVINKNKDWEFGFMGSRFTYIEQRTGDNHSIIGAMPIMEYFRYLNSAIYGNPQLMMFPLCNTKFNAAKSNISFLEGTYAGAAFIGNKELPEFNLECAYDIKDLEDVLKYYESSLRDANELAWEYICDNLLLSKINKLRENRIFANI